MPVAPTLFLEFHGAQAEVAAQAEERPRDRAGARLQGYEAAADETERRRLWHARHGAYEATRATQPGCEGLTTDVVRARVSSSRRCCSRPRPTSPSTG